MNGGADAEILESFAKTTTNGASRTHRERKRSKLSDRKLCELSSSWLGCWMNAESGKEEKFIEISSRFRY